MDTKEKTTQEMPDQRKVYSQPMVIYEIEMETRAGSPLGISNYEDPLSIIEP